VEVKLSPEQQRHADKLWQDWEETVRITAKRAQKSWCSAYTLDDLMQDGFLVLLSVSGLSRTPGKYDPARPGGKNGPATFKTYLVSSLFNHYRDLGSIQALRASRVVYTSEYVEAPVAREEAPTEAERHFLYEQLWTSLRDCPVGRVIVDVRLVSYPQRVSLTRIAHLLAVPYDKVLAANAEVQRKLTALQYNTTRVEAMEEDDCFGRFPDQAAPECRVCCDFALCRQVCLDGDSLTVPEGTTRVPRGVPLMATKGRGGVAVVDGTTPPPAQEQLMSAGETQMAEPIAEAPIQMEQVVPTDQTTDGTPVVEQAPTNQVAPTPKAPPAPPKMRHTMMDVALERLIAGPSSREELAAAITNQYPNNKGTRANDLIVVLKSRGLLSELDAVTEQGPDGKDVQVKRITLVEGALDTLRSSGELQEESDANGTKYHLVVKA